jgi:hypothetical protein
MLTHLPRSAEVRRLYRKGLELSREFPDPCGRNYLMRRVQEVFRKRARETSPTKIGRHIKEGRQSVRRMERALHGREDYARVTQLAYGAVGRVKHLLAAADAELDAHHLPERRNRNRPPKFSLPPLEGEARETFTLGLLLRKIEQLNPHASRDENEDVAEPDAEAVRRQLEALWDSVPPPRRRPPRPDGKKRFREDWLPRVWDVARGSRPPTHWRGFCETADWETAHVALLRTTFRPTVEKATRGFFASSDEDAANARRSSLPSASEEALRGRGTRTASLTDTDDERATRTENNDEKHEHTITIPSLRRSWRRFYGAALGLDAAAPLMIENAPDAWNARGKDKKGDDDESASRPRVVLTHRGRAVDEFAA